MTPYDRLAQLGLTLPPPPKPVLCRGDLADGCRSLETSVALYDPDRHIPLTFQ
jgi:hypothetical protein